MKLLFLKPYPPDAKESFRKEKKRLEKILSSLKHRVEHVGSTSVPGLSGKGIIDILILVNEGELERARDALERAGYEYDATAGKKDRKFFVKSGTPIYHIHLCPHGSRGAEEMILIRDYLLKNKKEAKNYEKLKEKWLKQVEFRRKGYRRLKAGYMRSLIKRAKQKVKKFTPLSHL